MTQLETVKPQTMENSKKFREFRAANKMSQEQLGALLGVSANYIYLIESGKKQPSETLEKFFDSLAISPIYKSGGTGMVPPARDVDLGSMRPVRRVPLISMAHAGALTSYEELPIAWQTSVPTECEDENAFALTVEGDCMMDEYREGDVIVVAPNEKPRDGGLVVARLKTDDIVFRRLTRISATKAKLECLNADFKAIDITENDLVWMYPVDSMVRKVRKS